VPDVASKEVRHHVPRSYPPAPVSIGIAPERTLTVQHGRTGMDPGHAKPFHLEHRLRTAHLPNSRWGILKDILPDMRVGRPPPMQPVSPIASRMIPKRIVIISPLPSYSSPPGLL